jgi:hypothetical protein
MNLRTDHRERMLTAGIRALSEIVHGDLSRWREPIRPARAAAALLAAGCSGRSSLFSGMADYLIARQRPDGGWADPEETAWANAALHGLRGQDHPAAAAGKRWLQSARHPQGGWGRHPRDQARIITTALVNYVAPDLLNQHDRLWLAREWRQDFESNEPLSYKAGFFLLSIGRTLADDLAGRTINYLKNDQNDDGGFAPWKGHPQGSEPWSTGVALWGLSSWPDRVHPTVVQRAIDWLADNQLPNGFWPYHYIDDGSALALIGAVSALKAWSRSD